MKQDKPKFMIFENRETWLQSIASDLMSLSLAIVLMFLSAWLNQTLWTVCSLVIFAFCMTHLACESRWTKLKNKQQAIEWANSLEDDEPPKEQS